MSVSRDDTSMPRVAALFVHPIKSAAAQRVRSLPLDDRGAVGDRRWLVIDATGLQITARETPQLALVRPRFEGATVDADGVIDAAVDGALILSAKGLYDFRVAIPTADSSSTTRPVKIWNDVVSAIDAGDDAAQWLSHAIGKPCRLVRLDETARRPLQRKYAGPLPFADRRVAFSDGAPLLVLSQASIDALSERLVEQGDEPMTVARFRPNVLLTNTQPHEEDTWTRIRIGDVDVGVGSQCSRCVMTTVNPQTAEKGLEPLRMLARYRRVDGEVMFGMNATHSAPGIIHEGDVVNQAPS